MRRTTSAHLFVVHQAISASSKPLWICKIEARVAANVASSRRSPSRSWPSHQVANETRADCAADPAGRDRLRCVAAARPEAPEGPLWLDRLASDLHTLTIR